MANSDYDREREINEIGHDKVASNNKKHMELKKKKEGLAKKLNYGVDYTKKRGVDKELSKAFESAGMGKGRK